MGLTTSEKQGFEYAIQGNYGYGWKEVTAEKTFKEAQKQLRCYNENEPDFPHRIKKQKVTH